MSNKSKGDILVDRDIPMKALTDTPYRDDDERLFNCPNCDTLWYYSNNKNEWNYCPNCGQKLDWSE